MHFLIWLLCIVAYIVFMVALSFVCAAAIGYIPGWAFRVFFAVLFGLLARSLCKRWDDRHAAKAPPQNDLSQVPRPDILKQAPKNANAPSPRLPESDNVLFYLCPNCGLPSPTTEHACKCGYRLSDMLPVYRLCPDCKRFVPQSQARCECGHSFPAEEQLLHVCPACGSVLPMDQKVCDCGYQFQTTPPSAARPEPQRPSPSVPAGSPAQWPLPKKILYGVAICGGIALILYFGIRNHSKPSASIPTEPPVATSIPTERPTLPPTASPTPTHKGRLIPLNGWVLIPPTDECVAPFEVSTPNDSLTDYYIVLSRTNSHDVYMSFYVHGGQSAKVDVPLGEFEIFYACGYDWQGTSDLFGSYTAFFKCDGTFPFTKDSEGYNGWTLTLYPVDNGNMDSEPVSEAEFPA